MTVYGRVSKVWKTRAGSKAPNKIVLEDDSGTLDVVHWLKEGPKVNVGDELEIRGSVGVYENRIQLKVWDAEDIQPLEESAAGAGLLKVADIVPEMEKQRVTVEGILGAPRALPGGVIYPLNDGSGSIELLLWDKNISGEERDALDEGVRIRVEAPVVVYKGTLELVPDNVGGFQTLE